MMLKFTTLMALAAALASTAQAAAVEVESHVEARQPEYRPCPINGTACGYALLERLPYRAPCLTEDVLWPLVPFNRDDPSQRWKLDLSLYNVTDGVPTRFHGFCPNGCNNYPFSETPNAVCY